MGNIKRMTNEIEVCMGECEYINQKVQEGRAKKVEIRRQCTDFVRKIFDQNSDFYRMEESKRVKEVTKRRKMWQAAFPGYGWYKFFEDTCGDCIENAPEQKGWMTAMRYKYVYPYDE